MAMAARCFPRLLATAAASSRLRALPAFSALAPAPHAPLSTTAATGSTSFLEAEPCGDTSFARLQLDKNSTCLRVSSFPVIDGGVRRFASFSNVYQLSSTLGSNEPLYCNAKGLGLQILAGQEIHDNRIRCFSTKVSPPPSDDTVAIEAKDESETKPKTLDDFQHEEITGPTVERDLSPVADELREALVVLQKRIVSFQKSLFVLGCAQVVGAVWCHVSWQSLDPTWQLLPSILLSFTLAFVLRHALQPITFFGKLEERSRLRIITLSLMISKGFASFFNRARILVAASVVGLLCILLYNPLTYILGLFGILK
ncbi:hypothetical protein KC19_6G105000 [Ceratodon purpureus]|uniref:Uncharacterized protein n=1 Tax=Ceratodon purpureus TaxID=3225 RepID=A0A8T0HDQ0_CERPU|nr:hypothetical protein KC19_6G105000 [Ceratodon purpureus]